MNNIDYIKISKTFSEKIFKKLQKNISKEIDSKDFCIVATGSFSRGEASRESDLDYFVIIDEEKFPDKYFEKKDTLIIPRECFSAPLNKIIKELVPKDPGDTGTFGLEAIVSIQNLTSNLGGTGDGNKEFTRRMLFLLEGKYLFNEDLFEIFRKKLIEQYIKGNVSDHHLSRFFLNDIIRFYRTMATDFEHKVSEAGKNWGVRNIKLAFSRKLLYFAGLIVIAETAQKTRIKKIEETLEFLKMTPIERIKYCTGNKSKQVLYLYNYFLTEISKEEVRKKLDEATPDNSKKNEEFRNLKNESKHFSWALSLLLKQTYDERHPIHHALTF
ncbi:nucleotidyltransferase domain-containing protein [Aliarcobacter cryaerophilus]|uniref:nucleotidyltransferase domain-containing protein n=1 Tax=Aliarcobacter cryaerophilus TaxID=28198 RepID=UPI003DA32E61